MGMGLIGVARWRRDGGSLFAVRRPAGTWPRLDRRLEWWCLRPVVNFWRPCWKSGEIVRLCKSVLVKGQPRCQLVCVL